MTVRSKLLKVPLFQCLQIQGDRWMLPMEQRASPVLPVAGGAAARPGSQVGNNTIALCMAIECPSASPLHQSDRTEGCQKVW